jgi:hypothetical protein
VVLAGIRVLETGQVQSNLVELNRHFGLSFIDDLIRRKRARELGGLEALDWDWHKQELARCEERLNAAYQNSKLPDDAPWDEVNRFLLRLRLA